MKINKSNVLVICIIFICFGCKKECTEYKLGDLTLYNPLKGDETVIYTDSAGKEVFFVGNGRNRWLNTGNENGKCNKVEIDDCFYWDSENDYSIFIRLAPTTFYQSAFLFIELADYRYNNNWHYTSTVYFNIPLDKDNLDVNQFYIDSLYVSNTIQYDVFAGVPDLDRTPTTKETLLDTVHPSMFYYNKQNGLVKVDSDDGTTWELKEIIY